MFFFINADTGWVVGWNGTIKKTTNGGLNWITQTNGNSYDINCMYFIDLNNGWIGNSYGQVFRTTNSGSTWSLQATFTSRAITNFTFSDQNNGWGCCTTGYIIKTTNGGNNWITQTTGSFNTLNSIYANDSTDVWAVDVYGGILHYTYYVQKPVLVSPQNNKDSLPLHPLQLKWDSTQYAVSYAVQVATDSNFTSILWSQIVQTDTTTLFPILNPNFPHST